MIEEQSKLFEILRDSLWSDGTLLGEAIPDEIRKELREQTVEGLTSLRYPDKDNLRYKQAARFVWMVKVQTEAVQLLQEYQIPVVVIKGTASGVYYPAPYLRTYGDIDLLVQPEQYQPAIALMRENGYVQERDIGRSHTALYKGEHLIELHQSPPGLEDVPEGVYILQFLRDGFRDIQTGTIAQPQCSFPMLPWQQNGLELIWHFREHLYNGIGLRHVIDWMMFVHQCLDDRKYTVYKDMLERAGLLVLAKTVTRMCQIYLGLEESITWCKDVPEALCVDLMEFILEQGNFGHKKTDDKEAKILTRYRTPGYFLKGMQRKGLYSWDAAKKYQILRPFAWMYIGVQGAKHYLTKEGWARLAEAQAENSQRRKLFDQLYGKKLVSEEIRAPHVSWAMKTKAGSKQKKRKTTGKQKLRAVYEWVNVTPLRIPLYYLENAWYAVRYASMGIPRIPEEDIRNVEENATFIYKSFNRQKKARKLYQCLKRYYPNARVVIADDSAEPLRIEKMDGRDKIVYLPFNSGLSQGLIAALAEVKTPYVFRMDDDELLTPKSRIHDQLSFLQKHENVDLVGLQAAVLWPEKRAENYSRIRMNKKLLIPAGTMIDGREVVYKTADLFLIKTETLRSIGWDPNIRMMIHQEFFYRAAGKIVSVQDPYSYVLHCHNHFEKKNYNVHRGNTGGDAAYIAKKHGTQYR